jgi:hypothetical protein
MAKLLKNANMSNPRKNNISDNEQLSLDFGFFDIVPPKKCSSATLANLE